MPWVYLDDSFPEHEKVEAAGGDAGWLFICGLCFANKYLTGGRILKRKVPGLSDRKNPTRLALTLVEVGLWEDAGDAYLIHDYQDWNRGAAERSKKGRKAANARWAKERAAASESPVGDAHASPEQCSEHLLEHDPSNAQGTGSGCRGTSAKQKQENSPPELTLITSDSPDAFDRFWAAWPRKMDKPAARRAWSQIEPNREAAEIIIARVVEQAAVWETENAPRRFIPYPATWLNGRRWLDQIDRRVPQQPAAAPSGQSRGRQALEEYWDQVVSVGDA